MLLFFFSLVLDIVTAYGKEESGSVNSHLKLSTPDIIPYILSCCYFLYLLFTCFQVGTFWQSATSLGKLFRADGVCHHLSLTDHESTLKSGCLVSSLQSLLCQLFWTWFPLPSHQPLVTSLLLISSWRSGAKTLPVYYAQFQIPPRPSPCGRHAYHGTPDCSCFTASLMQWLNSCIQYLQCSVTDDAHFWCSESAAVLCSRQLDSALNLCFLLFFPFCFFGETGTALLENVLD